MDTARNDAVPTGEGVVIHVWTDTLDLGFGGLPPEYVGSAPTLKLARKLAKEHMAEHDSLGLTSYTWSKGGRLFKRKGKSLQAAEDALRRQNQ